MRAKNILGAIWKHILLAILAFIWLIPIIWLVVTAFSGFRGINTSTFFPDHYSASNFNILLLHPDKTADFPHWFMNSLIVGIGTCIVSALFVLQVSYAFSCMRFKARKPLMSFSIILGMFPGVLSMIAIYFVLKMLGLTNSLLGLIIVYSGGSGLGFLICKGFFDTVPVSLREAAKLEGASEFTIFTRIVIPLSKPIIVYTIINSFITPWMDFVMARLMIRSKEPQYWTVAIGLYNLLEKEVINNYFGIFCAGGCIVAIPISILFLIMQKFYVEGITGGAVKG